MLSIKDYLNLKNIYNYLSEQRDIEIRDNNGYSNQPIENLTKMQKNLEEIIYKLEQE